MTNSEQNGHGAFPSPKASRLPADFSSAAGLGHAVPLETPREPFADFSAEFPSSSIPGADAASAMAAASPSTGSLGQGTFPIMGGMDLPKEFTTGHFLDPSFMSGLVNELYGEGRSIAQEPDVGNMLDMGRDGAALARGVPENLPPPHPVARSVPLPGLSPEKGVKGSPIDYQDPKLFLGVGDDLRTPLPIDLPKAPVLLHPTGSEAYYFLPQSTSAASPVIAPSPSSRSFQVEAVRKDFPILKRMVHGKPLIWLDNAATTQKPRRVIEALTRFYEHDNSNIHRAAHTLAARATNLYEDARDKVRRFLGAAASEEIIFVHGATEAINLVAQTFGRKYIGKGDEIVLSTVEHHSNIIPWHQLVVEKGAVLRIIPVNDRGEVMLEDYEKLLGPRTRFVAITHVSNALGTILPVRTMTQLAHRHGAKVLLDGAQSVPHLPVDVQSLGCDFYAFSGHKLFAPTGIGVLYGKKDVLESMPPWQGGGNMIDQVTFENVTYQHPPARFEAGTGILAGAVGLGAAIDYLDELGLENISRYEHELLLYATEGLSGIPGLRMIGTANEKASVLSFVLDGVRTEDMGRYLDHEGIAVRAGHHCAQPTMNRFGVASTVRPSLALYNTHAEIDALVEAVRKARSVWG